MSPNHVKFIWFGDIHGPKPYKFHRVSMAVYFADTGKVFGPIIGPKGLDFGRILVGRTLRPVGGLILMLFWDELMAGF